MADNASAFGQEAYASGKGSTAIGYGATAAYNDSTAIGTGAKTQNSNEIALGTSDDSIRAPGITSGQSRARQSGPLEIVTSDLGGNLATDGGDLFKTVGELKAGVAIALAVDAPDLSDSEKFAMRVGWGNFQGDANAVGFSAVGLICRECFSGKISLYGSAVGWSDYKTYNADAIIGNRLGMRWSWK